MAEHLRKRFQAPGPKRILALDGGGSRGVLTLGILSRLEAHLRDRSGRPDFRLCDYFDLIGGTSTGAIIATGLALGYSVAEITRLYFELCPKLFSWRPPFPLATYSSEPLRKALYAEFSTKTLGSKALKTGLAIHMKRIDSGSPWVVVNNSNWVFAHDIEDEKGNLVSEGNLGFYLKDLTLASASAPTFFKEARLVLAREDGKATKTGYFVDGGVSPNNNPSLQLLHTVTDPAFGFKWPTGEDAIFLLSLGAGYVRLRFDNENPARHSSAKSIKRYEEVGDVEKLKAIVAGYNHDISLQQIMTLQALSRPRWPWMINMESQLQVGAPFLSAAPSLTFQRLDVRLERAPKGARRPEHLEGLLDDEFSNAEMDEMRRLDIADRKLMDRLYRAGEALVGASLEDWRSEPEKKHYSPILSSEWPPKAFD